MVSQIKPYKRCKKCGSWIVSGDLCEDCKPMTNGDKIRAMTDEELAEFIDIYNIEDICKTRCAVVNYQDCIGCENCKGNILLWLKQEVSEDAGTD